MSTLYLPVSIPGSGKSTLARQWVMDHRLNKFGIVSPDDIRGLLYGDPSIQGDAERVFGIAYEQAWRKLRAGQDVYFDATNLTRKTQRQLIRTAHRTGALLVWLQFAVSPEVCRQRNAARKVPVPDHVMDRMEQQLAEIDFARLPGMVYRVDLEPNGYLSTKLITFDKVW